MAVARIKTKTTDLKKRKMLLRVSKSLKFEVYRSPTTADMETGRTWKESERAGRVPILRSAGPKSRKMSLVFELGHTDGRSIWSELKTLASIAKSSQPVEVTYTANETGKWTVTSFQYQITHRNTNHNPKRAQVSMELTYAGALSKASNPTNGGKRPTITGGTGHTDGPRKVRRYTVKKGDTLWDISRRFYGDPYKWRKIADANKITNQYRLRIGTVLRIP